ncbi:hypothetical protein ONA23_06315 [Mycoplasmopsis cynos]|nr:hypothetical protein [Mycoplasmopsis cynos]WAM06535.1 hypothetical protein ONA23_06315 [Mycoplasmopsis cynos]
MFWIILTSFAFIFFLFITVWTIALPVLSFCSGFSLDISGVLGASGVGVPSFGVSGFPCSGVVEFPWLLFWSIASVLESLALGFLLAHIYHTSTN